jgi:hypothetical protein
VHRFDAPYCSQACWRASEAGKAAYRKRCAAGSSRLDREALDPPAPSLEEIAAECAKVRATWSKAEPFQRLRCDERPIAWTPPGARLGQIELSD